MISLRPPRRSRIVVACSLASLWLPSLQASSTKDNSIEHRVFTSGFELFYAGPQWLVEALPSARRASTRHFDRAGDVVESTAPSSYVRTLHGDFDADWFGSTATFGRSGSASTPIPPGPSAVNAIITWDGNGSPFANAWLTGASWSTDTVPGSTDTASFATNAGSTAITINFGDATNNGTANQIVGAIALTGGESKSIASSSLTGGTLTLNGVGGVLLSNSSAFTLTLQNGGSSPMNVALANSGAIDVTSTGAITISSSISGAGTGFSKTGSGVLNLSGANFYSGG